MKNKNFGRRDFIRTTGLAAAGAMLGPGTLRAGVRSQLPAVLGGTPVRTKEWPAWPIWNRETDEPLVVDDLRSGIWSRASLVTRFEKEWGDFVGTKRCLSVVNGTNALITSLLQLGIGGGDEVIVPPYTFIATVAAVLATGAMPVFVDTDPATWQIDANKIEAKITSKTRAIVPVHILGLPADMVKIMAIAKKHGLVVIEDACQAHGAEIGGRKVGSFGDAGCFSFQNSKNLAIGEGGAITSNDDAFMDKCYSYHNYGNPYGSVVGQVNAGTLIAGNKLRLTEYQAAIGIGQLKRLGAETELRNANAAYLRERIGKIPGVTPYTFSPGVTKAAFHLFPFRYDAKGFKGLPRAAFLKALNAEGIPCSEGYAPLNKMPYLQNAFQSKNYKKMYTAAELDINAFNKRNNCPLNDKLCNEEAVWFYQSMLLGTRADMDDIVDAIQKIHDNADKIK
ncbi:DegT/DnrJ/EryC1/StrS family aminotransferase [Puia sp. P3]|uniref:DegT/DnrJ/EryC1/StrS family aminotransferase n=1 Tax=Puia sp. P3 TaxID=3423952 RepID=UPI003D6708EA